ncbi:hypothetical protein K474DRAFT_1010279 [Panus rudis PR-1116 ss-1]|nr:hypothetical protein K474DRAFT_1010279 [Panus rudis PR-1116 ss-1]
MRLSPCSLAVRLNLSSPATTRKHRLKPRRMISLVPTSSLISSTYFSASGTRLTLCLLVVRPILSLHAAHQVGLFWPEAWPETLTIWIETCRNAPVYPAT